MTFPLPVDRGVSRYLRTIDFVSFRKTSRLHYNDEEAWTIYASKMPLNCKGIDGRRKIGLHFLFYWALQFPERVNTKEWFQRIVNWLEYKTSIKIMYSFLFHSQLNFLMDMDTSKLDGRRRFVWLRLWHQNSRVFKRVSLDYDIDDRPQKRDRHWEVDQPQKCMADTIQMYRNTQQRCR